MGAASLVLVVIYPLMKRITYWPQAFLGLTFNWGILVGWTAITSTLPTVIIPLYMSGVMWTLMYDTIYAIQDRNCDVIAGVKSSAIRIQGHTKLFLSLMSAGQISLLVLAGYLNGQGIPFYLIGCGGAMIHLGWQIYTLIESNLVNVKDRFMSNAWVGFVILLGVVSDIIYKRNRKNKCLE